MAFVLGPKTIIVNDATIAELQFFAKKAGGIENIVEAGDDFGAAYANLATSPDTQTAEGTTFAPAGLSATLGEGIAQADMLRIKGFVDLVGADIVSVIGAKGVSPTKEVATVTITVPGTIVARQEITLEIKVQAANLPGELASDLSDYIKIVRLTKVLKATDTATTIAADFQAQLDSIAASVPSGLSYVTSTVAAGVLTFTSQDAQWTFGVTAVGSAIDAGTVAAAFAVTTPGYAGRNTYTQLKGLRLETALEPYGEQAKIDQIPLKSAKYSSYLIKKKVTRPDLLGLNDVINGESVGYFEYLIYVNEANAQYIYDLTHWLNANVANRTMYTATTSAGATATPETTVVATTVDASAPFSTGLS